MKFIIFVRVGSTVGTWHVGLLVQKFPWSTYADKYINILNLYKATHPSRFSAELL